MKSTRMVTLRRICRLLVLAVLLALALILVPAATSLYHLSRDPGLRSAAPSSFALSLHRSLSLRIPHYVDERIASGKAETLGTHQISATEWPVYGAFFYLLATENLQRDWEKNRVGPSPRETGTEAIEASVRLMLDPGHAHWVRLYWGDDHLDDPNCFYRTLLIGSLTAHHNLTGSDEHLPLLREVTLDLVADLDASPVALLDDYPDQCFPCDVVAAIAMVVHADSALGTDHRVWARQTLKRMLANFPGELPPYTARVETGEPRSQTRGCTNGYFFTFARTIEPTAANTLYQLYLSEFWQEKLGSAGWREFAASSPGSNNDEFYFDPDSGPVVSGFGTGATGLGLGAARRHDDHERAGKLGSELIATSLPLPCGRLLIPSLVSDHEHAPLFPEIVLLHQLSISGNTTASLASLPVVAWLVLAAEFLVGLLALFGAFRLLRKWRRKRPTPAS